MYGVKVGQLSKNSNKARLLREKKARDVLTSLGHPPDYHDSEDIYEDDGVKDM